MAFCPDFTFVFRTKVSYRAIVGVEERRIDLEGRMPQSPDREESIFLSFLLSDGRGIVALSGKILFLK